MQSVRQHPIPALLTLIAIVLVVVIGLARGAGGRGGTQVSQHASGSSSLSGAGDHTGPPFTLGGGDYILTWSADASADSYSGTGVNPALVIEVNDAAGNPHVALNTTIPDMTKRSGTEYLYGLPSGEYHFEVLSGAPWSASIEPR